MGCADISPQFLSHIASFLLPHTSPHTSPHLTSHTSPHIQPHNSPHLPNTSSHTTPHTSAYFLLLLGTSFSTPRHEDLAAHLSTILTAFLITPRHRVHHTTSPHTSPHISPHHLIHNSPRISALSTPFPTRQTTSPSASHNASSLRR